jgi:hypothetical protein
MRVDGNIVEDIQKKQLIWYGHGKKNGGKAPT